MKLISYIIALLILFSCQSAHDERQELYDRVMSIHDNAMAEMGTINSLRKAIKDSLNKDTFMNSNTLEQTLFALDQADSIMWDWMHNFDQEAASQASDTSIQYLKREEKRIKTVQEMMESAIHEGKSIVHEQKK